MCKVCIPLSVLDTKVKLGMVQFKAFLLHTKSLFPWASLANPSCFICFPLLVSLLFARKTLHLLVFDFMVFHSFGVFLLTGQLFLPVSMVISFMATLDGLLSNLGTFWRSKVHISWINKMKSSLPSPFWYYLWKANAYCITSIRKSFLHHLYDFLSISKLSSCWSTRSPPPILW